MISGGKPKKSLQPYVVAALLLVAAVFLTLQMRADRILTLDEGPPPHSRQMSTVANPDLLSDEFFSSPFMFDSGLMSMKKEMDKQRDLMLKSFSSGNFKDISFPAYKVKEDDSKVTVTVSVPDVPLKDINIEVIDGRVMHISGGHKTEKKRVFSETRFDKRFALGRNMDKDNISAKLKNGELTIETPKIGKIQENNVKKIEIQEL